MKISAQQTSSSLTQQFDLCQTSSACSCIVVHCHTQALLMIPCIACGAASLLHRRAVHRNHACLQRIPVCRSALRHWESVEEPKSEPTILRRSDPITCSQSIAHHAHAVRMQAQEVSGGLNRLLHEGRQVTCVTAMQTACYCMNILKCINLPRISYLNLALLLVAARQGIQVLQYISGVKSFPDSVNLQVIPVKP